MSEQQIEPPIPLTAPDGRLFGYACPRCLYYRLGVSGGTFEWRVEESERMAARCCTCLTCGTVLGKPYESQCGTCRAAARRAFEERLEAERPEREAREARQATALEQAKDRNAALALQRLMSDVSEEYYCAGWLTGLEFELWPMLNGGSRRFGMGEVGEDEVAQLKALSEQAGGWWRWDDEDGQTFTTLDEWQAVLASKPHSSAGRGDTAAA
jgi:hypothetical protein